MSELLRHYFRLIEKSADTASNESTSHPLDLTVLQKTSAGNYNVSAKHKMGDQIHKAVNAPYRAASRPTPAPAAQPTPQARPATPAKPTAWDMASAQRDWQQGMPVVGRPKTFSPMPLSYTDRFLTPLGDLSSAAGQAVAGTAQSVVANLADLYARTQAPNTAMTSPMARQDYARDSAAGWQDVKGGLQNAWRAVQRGYAGVVNDPELYHAATPATSAVAESRQKEIRDMQATARQEKQLDLETGKPTPGLRSDESATWADAASKWKQRLLYGDWNANVPIDEAISRMQGAEDIRHAGSELAGAYLPTSPAGILGNSAKMQKVAPLAAQVGRWTERGLDTFGVGAGVMDAAAVKKGPDPSNPVPYIDKATQDNYVALRGNAPLHAGLQQAFAGAKTPEDAAKAAWAGAQNYLKNNPEIAKNFEQDPALQESVIGQVTAASRLYARQNNLDEATTVVRTKAMLRGVDFDPAKPPTLDKSFFPNPRDIKEGQTPEQLEQIKSALPRTQGLLEESLLERKAQAMRNNQPIEKDPLAKQQAASLTQHQVVLEALNNHDGDLVAAVTAMTTGERGAATPEETNRVANAMVGRGEAPDALTAMGGLFSRMTPGTKALLFGGLSLGVAGLAASLLGGNGVLGLLLGLVGLGAMGGAAYQLTQSGELSGVLPDSMKEKLVERAIDSPLYQETLEKGREGRKQYESYANSDWMPTWGKKYLVNPYANWLQGEGFFNTQDPIELALNKNIQQGIQQGKIPPGFENVTRNVLRRKIMAD